ncbi:hypothetical protein [Actinomadura violacea]|uniref:Uncharacterized protein n=1 Tax=Actinomadura violacea TaxID=2819934 RepID=A0ABS3RZQ2_9ACTN|nr:hypothetical protein [Actinomadura violacea]MBO2461500.1 hypothetical protein [Actinomadura violacea]
MIEPISDQHLTEILDQVESHLPEIGLELRAEISRLREDLGIFAAENTKLRDWQRGRLIDERKHGDQVRKAALDAARARSLNMAVHALASLRDPLRHLARQIAQSEGFSRLGLRAHELLQELEREPEPGSAEQVIADIRAEHDRFLAEKVAMWNCLSRHGLTHEIGEVRS